jgi:hypothetical protein
MDGVRILNRVVSVLLAVALIAGGVLVAVEIVLAALDRDPWVLPHDEWYRSARETPWSDGDARLVFGVLALVGLVLLVLELLRRRTQALPLADRSEGARADLDRRGVERWLAGRLADVEGASDARAKVKKRQVAVSAATPQRDVAEVQQRLEASAADHLDELDLAAPLRVRAKVESRRSS